MAASGQITFESVGQIKSTVYYDRQNIRFHVVNGKLTLLAEEMISGTNIFRQLSEMPTQRAKRVGRRSSITPPMKKPSWIH